MIEEFMIMANEEISKKFCEDKIPFLYRIHEKPSEESLKELAKIMMEYWIPFNPAKDNNPIYYSKIIDMLLWRKEQYMVSKQILMAMSKAKYDSVPLWHFGLALRYYSHFTSPIRRYPDLQIHRIINEYLVRKMTKKEQFRYAKLLPKVAKMTSTSEQKAEELQRKIENLKTIEYMTKFIWTEADAKISWLTANWMYAELESWVEWFIIWKNLDKYAYDDTKRCYKWVWKNWNLSIWDKIKIRVAKADKNLWFLDFELV